MTGDVHGLSWEADVGNPGGALHAIDDATGNTWGYLAPAKFLGDQSGAVGNVLSYDLWTSASDAQPWSWPMVELVGNGVTLDWSGVFPTVGEWNSYSVPLSPAGWTISAGGVPTAAEFEGVMGNLTSLYIRGEFMTGADFGRLDNVALVPEATWGMGAPLMALLARRSRR